MKKIRKKLIREKAVVAVYQYILVETTNDEIIEYLNCDKDFKNNKEEFEHCLNLINQTIENIDNYKNQISSYLRKDWTIDRLSKMEQAIMLVGICELLAQDIDKSVVINEAVELTKKYCDDDSYKYVNGVLNQIN